ncbi:uncharacterized protein BO80DRAFT_123837 [Aspergillus ibericus CBS 121593]|uniref:GPI anchored cell wall protein n=1 Tax=Aspergillus ibericus CBS 121593 TaxID=1448316 RepID=A0A395GVA5_9EURO|nr:hypothetical protein BO80DRAFT_123837 [Aspergillus ibericus CBS 121593]RAK99435.1 hypothetical protein BO80DRAFT_123837 [Aspergillus ibericus CBS 121593]
MLTMKLAVLLLGLAALGSARGLVTTEFLDAWTVNKKDKLASVLGNDGIETTYSMACADSQAAFCEVDGLTVMVGGSQTTIVGQISATDTVDMFDKEGLSRAAMCAVEDTTSVSCTVTARQETPSPYRVVALGFMEHDISQAFIPVTVTAGTIPQPSDTVVTMPGSSSSHPTSHRVSPSIPLGSGSHISSAEPRVSGDPGSMSIMTTKSHTSTSSSSSSTRSTGGAPMATGEVAIMAGGAAMALLIAVL